MRDARGYSVASWHGGILKMTEKDASSNCTRMSESDHRIANHLALLSGFVRLKSSELTRRKTVPDATDIALLLAAIGVEINAIAHLHRLLSVDESRDSADLTDHLREICAALRSAVSRDVVITEAFETGCALPMNKIIPAAQIFTEVVSNAIKHGCPSGYSSRIEVSCTKDAQGTITLEVKDNGPGLHRDDRSTAVGGLGFLLVEGLAAQIGGFVTYVSEEKGLKVHLTIEPPHPSDIDFPVPELVITKGAQRV